jgi:hypothetical protein
MPAAIRFLTSPFLWLLAAAAIAAVVLHFPIRLPLGSNYWDIFTYTDSAYRMRLGQIPHVDFFVPVGALGYALLDLVQRIFPQAHTLLAVHLSLMLLTLPAMMVVAGFADRRSRVEALALVVPFLIFSLLPFNTLELYPSPGFDGHGNYNRHGAILLMVMASAVLFIDNRRVASWIAVFMLAALFMTKITGFLVGVVILVHALFAGRVSLRGMIEAALVIAVALGVVEWRWGMISAYVVDIVTLVRSNTHFLLPRILTVLSTKFGVIAPAVVLILCVMWREREHVFAFLRRPGLVSIGRLADTDSAWLASLLAVGIVYETQNTGSQEFIMMWPAILRLFRKIAVPFGRAELALLTIVAAIALPTPVQIIHRAARAVASAPAYQPLPTPTLGPTARLSVKPDILNHAREMMGHYADNRASFEAIAKRGILPSYIMFNEPDFHASWMMTVEEAAQALLAYERANNIRFERTYTLDFTDPLTIALGRIPPMEVSIGNDPTRTLMALNERAKAEIASLDAILVPKCPVTTARNNIRKAYEPYIAGRRTVELTSCFDMLLKR